VEYEPHIKVREKYKDYKFMKSFVKNEWNKFDSLPTFYKKLFSFNNIRKSHQIVCDKHEKSAIAFEGSYITIRIVDNGLLEKL